MKFLEYAAYDALGLAELLIKKEVTPTELNQYALHAIDRLNPTLNAVVEVFESTSIDCNYGEMAPFYGVPFLAKDNNIHIKGRKTGYASQSMQSNQGLYDSELAVAWRKAGLNVIGRTNLCEFATNFVSSPKAYGAARNPWNASLAPGGSSGGAAAAVAAGIAPMAHANDAGGSIRVPAAVTGLFGFKPGNGRTSTYPHHDWIWEGLNVEHVVTKTVRDSAAMLDVEMNLPNSAYLQSLESTGPAKLTIGYSSASLSGEEIAPEYKSAFEHSCQKLADMGHELIETNLPPEADASEAILDLIAFGIYELISEHVCNAEKFSEFSSQIEAANRALFLVGGGLGADGLLQARRARAQARHAVNDHLSKFDAFMSPAVSRRPPAIGECDANADPFSMENYLQEIFSFAPYTAVFNASGHPAATLPVAWSEDGFPLSTQIVVNRNEEALLLWLCRRLEETYPWEHHLRTLQKNLAAEYHV